MAEIKAEAGPTLLPRGRWVRLNPPGNRTGDGMRIIALCLRLAVKTAFAFCGLIGIVEEAAAEGPGSIIRVWPLEGGGPGNSEAFASSIARPASTASPSRSQAPFISPPVPRRRAAAT